MVNLSTYKLSGTKVEEKYNLNENELCKIIQKIDSDNVLVMSSNLCMGLDCIYIIGNYKQEDKLTIRIAEDIIGEIKKDENDRLCLQTFSNENYKGYITEPNLADLLREFIV